MKAVLVISERDNVATALEPLEPGRTVPVNGGSVTVIERIPSGHKIALAAIGQGQPVIKYGSSIGTATAPIPQGAHVHTHNVASGRGRGDMPEQAPDSEPRLAEPPDHLNDLEPSRSAGARGPG